MKKFVIPLLMIACGLFAHDRPDENPVRDMPEDVRCEILKWRTETHEGDLPKPNLSKQMVFAPYANEFHNPVMISPLGDVITTEEGAQYFVHPNDRFKTFNWLTSDALKITPNHAFFTSYDYRITNLNTWETVEVNIIERPVHNGVNTHWIIAIDYEQAKLCLEDNSVWDFGGLHYAFSNKSMLKKSPWYVNDTIIIGTNDGFFSITKPNILINCNIKSYPYIEAKCIN